tara:strand:+ start:152 stop:349 length:198 start_codon:yes stop_codon:yes gene_type:complete
MDDDNNLTSAAPDADLLEELNDEPMKDEALVDVAEVENIPEEPEPAWHPAIWAGLGLLVGLYWGK